MASLPKSYSGSQAQVQTVSASAKPSEVVAAVIAGAQGARAASNPNRGIHFAFVFILIFAVTIYFREELWSLSRDVSKHPIMGYVEQLQISHYLGAKWAFGSGKDVTPEALEAAKQQQQLSTDSKAGSNPAAVPRDPSQQTAGAAANATAAAATAGTQAQQQQAAGATSLPAATPASQADSSTTTAAAGAGTAAGTGSSTSGAPAAGARRRSWARRLLTINHSKCDNTNAKLLMRRLLVLAQRQRHLLG